MKIIFLNKQKKHIIDIAYYNFVVEKFIELRLKKYKNFDNLELYVSFVSPKKIRILKKQLFSLDIVTDVISIPIDTSDIYKNIPTIFGEIFICPEQAEKQSKQYGNEFRQEMSLLIIHGLLHLIGYDDNTKLEQKIMRIEEQKILKYIK